jgi:hypothetical protein
VSHDEPGLDPDLETAELRRQMEATGVSDYLKDDVAEVELESAGSLIARLKAGEPADDAAHVPAGESGRRLVPTLLAGTAAAVIAGILIAVQPWNAPVARAGTPPILDFEFAEAQRIADAPGVDPAETLRQLAQAADRNGSEPSATAVQHIVIEGWAIESDFDPDPDSTIAPTMTQNWLYPDGRFRSRAYRGEPLEADGRGIPRSGRLDRTTTFIDEQNEPAASRDAQFFIDMPKTVEGVRDDLLDDVTCLERQRGQERTFCLMNQIRNLPPEYVIPSDVMANIWRMLDEEEGIRSLGTVKDRTGRQAVALSFIWAGAPDYRLVLLADPDTGQVVGSERILIKPSPSSPVKPPAIQEFTAIVTSETQ